MGPPGVDNEPLLNRSHPKVLILKVQAVPYENSFLTNYVPNLLLNNCGNQWTKKGNVTSIVILRRKILKI